MLLCVVATAVMAHHSPVMFDMQKKTELKGTVSLFQWTNPHCYIQLLVKDDKGRDVEWNLEMAAPMYLMNKGWRPSSLKAGDAVTVTIAPLRSGKRGGLVLDAVRKDGSSIGKVKV
jgi:hypothetical protein